MPDSSSKFDHEVRETAANWVVRQDRGLSAQEDAELRAWLALDSENAMSFARSKESWLRFREIGATVRRPPVQRAFTRVLLTVPIWGGLAAAAGVVVALIDWPPVYTFWEYRPKTERPAIGVTAEIPSGRLPDGSTARLKADAEISVEFKRAERRVRLLRGEAFFEVEKDSARPFLVEVGDITVRAVGTAFAVRFDPDAIDVVVTEGTVRVEPAPEIHRSDLPATKVSAASIEAGQRGVVERSGATSARRVKITSITSAELNRMLAWKDPVLDLNGATLRELVSLITTRTGRAIEIGDPILEAVRIGGRFPIGDVAGFVRVLEEIYDVRAEQRENGTIVLKRSSSPFGGDR